jgi:hypothetical protein
MRSTPTIPTQFAVIQGPKARLFNRRVMDEDIWTVFLRDDPKPFVRVKPFHRALRHGIILLASDERVQA